MLIALKWLSMRFQHTIAAKMCRLAHTQRYDGVYYESAR